MPTTTQKIYESFCFKNVYLYVHGVFTLVSRVGNYLPIPGTLKGDTNPDQDWLGDNNN